VKRLMQIMANRLIKHPPPLISKNRCWEQNLLLLHLTIRVMKRKPSQTTHTYVERLILFLLLSLSAGFESLAQTPVSIISGDNIDYTVSMSDSNNMLIEAKDPALTLERGVTYVFQIDNLTFHPFWIKTTNSVGMLGSTGSYNNGVTRNGATSGNVTFAVGADAPDRLIYQCGFHSPMNGPLDIITPASPPTVKIVYINVANFITLKSTGANGWNATPEYLCDPSTSNWISVTPFTNSFANGTNTTTFPLIDPICGGSSVLLRVRNNPE